VLCILAYSFDLELTRRLSMKINGGLSACERRGGRGILWADRWGFPVGVRIVKQQLELQRSIRLLALPSPPLQYVMCHSNLK